MLKLNLGLKLKNHDYRLLVIDIDGTLLNGRGTISEPDRAALAKAREAGVQVTLSTGRALKACRRVVSELALDGQLISFDGALVSRPDLREEVCSQPISEAVVREMVEFAHAHKADLELYSPTHYFSERETWSTQAHVDFFGIESSILDFDGLWHRERIVKGGLVVTNAEEAAKAEIFKRHFADSLHFSPVMTPAYPSVIFNNILAPKVSKGRALEALASYLGVPLEQVMAVGDGSNDISLLSTAGLAVAMGNAPPEVKSVADHITLDVEHSGLAAAIERFLL